MKKIFLFYFFIFINTCFAQFSKTHYIPPLSGSNAPSAIAEEQYIYISTPNVNPINFKIINLGGSIITGTVSKAKPYSYFVGSGANTQLMVNKNSVNNVLSNKGYIIEAEDLIYVSLRVVSGNSNQAGAVVSKGLAALGKEFRIGALNNLTTSFFDENHYTFLSILATENNTTVHFSNLKLGVVLINNNSGNLPKDVILNSGESFVMAVEGPTTANRDGLIGSLVSSDKPIAVNCGSFTGSNAPTNLDLGFDQIVPVERTGTDYIFIKSSGQNVVENVLLIAHENGTVIHLNGNLTPDYTLNAGEYIALQGDKYDLNGSLYVKSNKKIFAYQTIGDNSREDYANQEMFFVPPLSCETPHVIDNIPQITKIGSRNFSISRITLIVEKNATLNFEINGNSYSLPDLNSIATSVKGPLAVTGNDDYETYIILGLTGNISALSSGQLYLAAYGTDGAATFGGFYSGFTFKPEITFNLLNASKSSCIPNTKLTVNTLSPFDTFQWFFNNNEIPNATTSEYTPTSPGYYYVKAAIGGCGTELVSDVIPVSSCATDLDNDGANDNVDVDNDNDGITDCTESLGNQSIDLSDISSLNIKSSVSATPSTTPFIGNIDGAFILATSDLKNSSVSFTKKFSQPTNISLEYVTTANDSDLLNTNAQFIINSDIDKTISVLNPDNQLLIDTNYDGIYESGITQFSSFEIRFRYNGSIPLAAGSGTFQFKSHEANSVSFTQINLEENGTSKSTFKLIETCVARDTDGDGIPDHLDLDSDNDGIPDNIEAQGNNFITLSNLDLDKNGLDDAYGNGLIPIDTDNDGIPNFLDLDSDNDGIYDIVESGNKALDTNNDGMIDGNPTDFGSNGLYNNLETAPNSGAINYTITDTDGDTISNYFDFDSDGDGCPDVIEAGFLDGNNNGFVGNDLPIVNSKGVVTNATAYTTPHLNYSIAAPIAITKQPTTIPTCELQNVQLAVEDNGGNTYQWQVATDGTSWINIINNTVYQDATTSKLLITTVKNNMKEYQYRVKLDKLGNSCGLISEQASLIIYDLPLTNDTSIVQCDDDLDGISTFNLTVKNDIISANYLNETFTYYKTLAGANAANPSELIQNPEAFTNSTPNTMPVWARISNENNCFNVAQITLKVSGTQINSVIYHRDFVACDDNNPSDTDGFSEFDFHTVTNDINNLLPNPSADYTITYFTNEADALSEINQITNISNYRNTIKNKQDIWVRIDSNLENACFGLGPLVTLTVNPLPNINLNENHEDDTLVCSNLPNFYVQLDAGLQDNSSPDNYSYIWRKDGTILSGKNAYTLEVNEEGTYTVEVSSGSNCSRIRTIQVKPSDIAVIQSIDVVDLSQINSITINVTGTGNYQYSLDNINGMYQTSNVFTNVPAGIYDVFVKDTNGCGTITQASAVVGVPKFFTPNNDGYNDYWNIKGLNDQFNARASIFIYNRYGKLLKEINPLDNGWDGTYNGNNLPSDDYWFTLKLEDGREASGHFSLKR